MLASEIASGIPHDADAVEDGVERGVEREHRERRRAVGIHGDCRLKKPRFSISINPLNASPSEKAASAPATTLRLVGVERAALVEQAHDRLGEHGARRPPPGRAGS